MALTERTVIVGIKELAEKAELSFSPNMCSHEPRHHKYTFYKNLKMFVQTKQNHFHTLKAQSQFMDLSMEKSCIENVSLPIP